MQSGCEVTGFLSAVMLSPDARHNRFKKAPLQLERCALHNNDTHVHITPDIISTIVCGGSTKSKKSAQGTLPVALKGCYVDTELSQMPALRCPLYWMRRKRRQGFST